MGGAPVRLSSDPQTPSRLRVLYIAGTGRSGSTLLAGILGQLPGTFNAGEVRYVWERGLIENRLCGCGRRFHDCPVWKAVLDKVGPVDPAVMTRIQSRLTRIRHLPSLVFRSQEGGTADIQAYRATLDRLYAAVAEVTGAGVVVDSSKLPSYGRILSTLPGIDLHVLQLVRDPRAAAGSWAGVKEQLDRGAAGAMERLSPTHSALLWDLWNSTAKGMVGRRSAHYMTLRYEDFVARPLESVRRIASMLGMGDAELPFVDATTVTLAANHTVAGNPDRLRSGAVRISSEAGSKRRLKRGDAALVTALTLPGLLRFGYPLTVRSNGAAQRPIGIQHLPEPLRTWRRLQRHWRWGREEGFGRLVEEDQLDPRARLAGAMQRRDWRRRHPIEPGSTTPVLVVGLQRSGTNMVTRALEANPEFEVRNENDRMAFDRFRLRPEPVVRDLVVRSRQRFLVLKPLIDSHRVDQLLASLKTPSRPKAIWVYRSVDGRVRSALSKFGDHNVQVLRAIAQGRAGESWQAQRASEASMELVAGLDLDLVTPETASAVIWYIRNSLYFELGLDRREDCLLVSYERVLDNPQAEIGRVCDFLGTDVQAAMLAGIGRRGPTQAAVPLDPAVRSHCADLESRLEESCANRQPV